VSGTISFLWNERVPVGQAVGATGSELSFQTLVPGQDSGFLHTHKTHEELYIILKGEGEYQVDGWTTSCARRRPGVSPPS
jgi:Uncharacterized conserved protein, contains double-stranded beta-helix domain